MCGVQRVEMRRSVFAPEHLDDDTEELADRGHGRDYAPGFWRNKAQVSVRHAALRKKRGTWRQFRIAGDSSG